jgi:hypothetical protein
MGNPPVHAREHLLMSLDHGEDDGSLKIFEYFVIHLEGSPHFGQNRTPTVVRKDREVITKLANRECPVQLFRRSIGLLEQWLRESHESVCKRSHVRVPPCNCTERLSNRDEPKAHARRGRA